MPSPFPGMDPYLEGTLWTTFHTQFGAEIARQLAPQLRPRYLALTTERFVLDSSSSVAITAGSVYPDVGVATSRIAEVVVQRLAEPGAPVRMTTVMPTPVPHVAVEIRDVAERHLVTAIELLSPTNKRGEGRAEYLARRQLFLLSSAHLLEIDLLRAGRRVPMTEPLPDAPYFVFLSRAEERPSVTVWPIPLDGPLPDVPVPLLAGDADVILHLQRALTTVYDVVGYDLAIDYTAPPDVPLAPVAAEWVQRRLRGSGVAVRWSAADDA